jgi:retron-type reverse transcriptase
MEVTELKTCLIREKDNLTASLINGRYHPTPVRRVEILKTDGSKRPPGIPTVVDRVIQQAISQKLSPIYEQQFSENSYGFRPGRSAHDALRQVQRYAEAGNKYAVDMDLEKYFDTVNQSKLIEVLSRTIKDGRVVSLIQISTSRSNSNPEIYRNNCCVIPVTSEAKPENIASNTKNVKDNFFIFLPILKTFFRAQYLLCPKMFLFNQQNHSVTTVTVCR